jgi:AraC-like DNA-binding protein
MSVRIEKLHCRDFLEQITIRQLIQAFDILPDVFFWIKDSESRFIYANQYLLEHLGMDTLEQAIGLTDYDLVPKHIAEQFIDDDQRVKQGEIISERLEINILTSGEICWFSTSKRPLYDDSRHIIGSYGISRYLEKTSLALNAVEQLKTPIDYIRKNYKKPIRVDEIAAKSHLSVSALEKRFSKHLAKTPKQFINEVRLENARRLLIETTLPISAIANQTGFPDPGYFTRQFSKRFGELPSDFRDNSQG